MLLAFALLRPPQNATAPRAGLWRGGRAVAGLEGGRAPRRREGGLEDDA